MTDWVPVSFVGASPGSLKTKRTSAAPVAPSGRSGGKSGLQEPKDSTRPSLTCERVPVLRRGTAGGTSGWWSRAAPSARPGGLHRLPGTSRAPPAVPRRLCSDLWAITLVGHRGKTSAISVQISCLSCCALNTFKCDFRFPSFHSS